MTLAIESEQIAMNTLLHTELEARRFSAQSMPFSTWNLIRQQ
jgi:hypothetical protein